MNAASWREDADRDESEALSIEVARILDDPSLDTAVMNQAAERLAADRGIRRERRAKRVERDVQIARRHNAGIIRPADIDEEIDVQ